MKGRIKAKDYNRKRKEGYIIYIFVSRDTSPLSLFREYEGTILPLEAIFLAVCHHENKPF